MKLRTGRMSLLWIMILMGIGISLTAAQNTHTTVCEIPSFEAAVHVGSDAGLSLAGTLLLEVTDGSAEGTMTRDDGTSLPLVGQVTGRAISLVIDLGDGQYIFGTGASWNDFLSCDSVGGGTFTGPNPGDLGDWGYAIGGRSNS